MPNLIPFHQSTGVPAHLAAFNAEKPNIASRETVSQLSFRGKVWRTVIDGEEQPLMNKDDEPVSSVNVVVLNFNKARSRGYYEGAFEEGKSQPPACWSTDGIKPDSQVKEPQSETCAKCPKSVKGSKITDNGKEVTACSVFKRLAVVPATDLTFEALLLRLAQTSMWDGKNEENEAKGFYAWDQYVEFLRKRGCNHTALVVTKVKFDPRVAYPKLLFGATRYLDKDEWAVVKERTDEEGTIALLEAPETAAAARKEPEAKVEAPKQIAAPKAAATADDDDDDDDEVAAAPAPAPAKKGKKAAPAPEPEAKADEDDDDDEEVVIPKKAKAVDMAAVKARVPERKKVVAAEEEAETEVEAAPKKGKAKDDKGLGALLEQWDD